MKFDACAVTGRLTLSAKGQNAHLRRGLHEFVSAFSKLRPNSSFAGYCRRRTSQTIYRHKLWGTISNLEFFSGVGSHNEPAAIYVNAMTAIIITEMRNLQRPATIVDLGCGDFSVDARLIERLPAVRYVGCDVVPELIEHHNERYARMRVQFRTIDIVSQNLPDGDICLVRQVFQHLPNRDIERVLSKLGNYRAVYVTEAQPTTRIARLKPPISPVVQMCDSTGEQDAVEGLN